MSSHASEELFRRWQDEGDELALAELMQRAVEYLRQQLWRKPGASPAARAQHSDIAQSSVRRFLEALEGPRPPRFSSWSDCQRYLMRIADNLLWSLLRRRGIERREPLPPDVETLLADSRMSRDAERRDLVEQLSTALRLMPLAERDLVVSKLKQEPAAELATRLAISPDAARMRRERAIELFRGLVAAFDEP